MAKRGAKPKYRKDYSRQAFVACSEGGFTDAKLAKLFDVTKRTIASWKHDIPEFLHSVKEGKEKYDTELVENSLLKRALGYKFTETTKERGGLNKDGDLAISKTVRKEVSADVKAQIFWLRNRNRTRWPDVRLSEGSLTVDNSSREMPDMPDDITAKDAEEVYRDIIGG